MNANGRIVRRGGGAAYKFTCKQYTAENLIPLIGKANDVAVISPVPIPSINSGGVILSPIGQPPTTRTNGDPKQEGDLWLATGNESNFPFEAVTGINIYGVACFQWISGSWVERAAKIWQGSAWIYWALYLYRYGEEYIDITGGWDGFSSIAKNADSLLFTCNSSINGAFVTHNKIDLTPYSTLKVLSKRYPAQANGAGAYISNLKSSLAEILSSSVASVSLTNDAANPQWTSLDVSALNGQYYVALGAFYVSETRGAYAYEVKLI